MKVSRTIKHPVQKHIVTQLNGAAVVRFKDLCPPRTDTNLFTYHLKSLVAAGIVEKLAAGYRLSTASALQYAQGINATPDTPTISVMLLVQNSDGDVLLERRATQPFIDQLSLPYGALSASDGSLTQAAARIAQQKLGLTNQSIQHAGEAYVRIYISGVLHGTSLVHVMRFNHDEVALGDTVLWARPHELHRLPLAPGVSEIIARGFFNDPSFFEEYELEIA